MDKNTVIDAVLELCTNGMNILCKLLFVSMFTALTHTAAFLVTFSYQLFIDYLDLLLNVSFYCL